MSEFLTKTSCSSTAEGQFGDMSVRETKMDAVVTQVTPENRSLVHPFNSCPKLMRQEKK